MKDGNDRRGSRRRSDIQGLRAVAVLLVVLFHAGLSFPGGFTGVDVFFAISGFVITGSLVAELEREERLSLPRFYARRIRRLLPALATMVVAVALAGILAAPVGALRMSALTGVFASAFSANVYLSALHGGYFATSTTLDPFLHTWTLAVEEQFYVVFPVALLGAWLLGLRSRRPALARWSAAVVLGALTVASFVLASRTLVEGAHGSTLSGRIAFFGAPARAWEFGAGALLALALPLARRLPRAAALAFAIFGAAVLAYAAFAIHGQDSFSAATALLPVAGACALLLAGLRENPVSALLGTGALRWIGDRSYSWYLWHWPCIVYARALAPGSGWAVPVAAAASLLPASLSYAFVENPLRYAPRVRGRAVVALAVVCVAAGIGGSLALLGAGRVLEATTVVASFATRERDHLDQTHDCHHPLGARPSCTWRAPGPAHGTVVLVGDSNAGHFSEPVVRAGNRDGLDVEIATYYSCPFADARISGTAVGLRLDGPACAAFDRTTLAALLQLRPSLVVVGTRSDLLIADPHQRLQLGGTGPAAASAAEKARIYGAALRRYVLALHRAGVPVLVVDPVPRIPVPHGDLSGCAVVLVLAERCSGSVSLARVRSQLRVARAADREAVRGIADAHVADFTRLLCAADVCASDRGKLAVYRDTSHLSVAGALTLTDRFAALIRADAR